jgi:hypothetical protein
MMNVATCWIFKIPLRDLGWALIPGIALAVSGALPILSLSFIELEFLGDITKACILLAAAGAAIALCLATVCRGFLREVVALAATAKPE